MCKFTKNQSFRRLEVTATKAKPTCVGYSVRVGGLGLYGSAISNSQDLFLQNWDAF